MVQVDVGVFTGFGLTVEYVSEADLEEVGVNIILIDFFCFRFIITITK